MTDERPEPGTVARAWFKDGSGSEMALMTVMGWHGERGPIPKYTEGAYVFEILETVHRHNKNCRWVGVKNLTTGRGDGHFECEAP